MQDKLPRSHPRAHANTGRIHPYTNREEKTNKPASSPVVESRVHESELRGWALLCFTSLTFATVCESKQFESVHLPFRNCLQTATFDGSCLKGQLFLLHLPVASEPVSSAPESLAIALRTKFVKKPAEFRGLLSLVCGGSSSWRLLRVRLLSLVRIA
jgi:hypothetical protein